MLQTTLLIIDILLVSCIITINLFWFFRSLFGLVLYQKLKGKVKLVDKTRRADWHWLPKRHYEAIDSCLFLILANLIPLSILFAIIRFSEFSINPLALIYISATLVFILPVLGSLILSLLLAVKIRPRSLKRFEYAFTGFRLRLFTYYEPVFSKGQTPLLIARLRRIVSFGHCRVSPIPFPVVMISFMILFALFNYPLY